MYKGFCCKCCSPKDSGAVRTLDLITSGVTSPEAAVCVTSLQMGMHKPCSVILLIGVPNKLAQDLAQAASPATWGAIAFRRAAAPKDGRWELQTGN